MPTLSDFYEDGLKDCSWINGDIFTYCEDMKVSIIDDVLLIYNGNANFKYIDTIYTMKRSRGKGLATKVLSNIKGRVALICSDKLLDFYKAEGFTNDLPYNIVIKDNR